MPRVSEDHLTARREQILDAALVCFRRNGLHSTSMQDLIREAGLSVGAVYRYFKSKNDIISAIAERVAGPLVVAVEEIAVREPRLPIPDAIELILGLIDRQLGPDGNFSIGLQVWAEATLDPAIGEIVRHRYEAIRAAFATMARRAIAAGELGPGSDPEAVAAVLFGTMPGYALQRLLIGTPDRQTYLHGLRAVLGSAR